MRHRNRPERRHYAGGELPRMASRVAGRNGRPWRRVRAQILATSTICWLCGHDGSDSADHLIPRAVCIAAGRRDLLEDGSNLAPAHHRPCPTCGLRCNRMRGMCTSRKQSTASSRRW